VKWRVTAIADSDLAGVKKRKREHAEGKAKPRSQAKGHGKEHSGRSTLLSTIYAV
jgi:hypothetical protein